MTADLASPAAAGRGNAGGGPASVGYRATRGGLWVLLTVGASRALGFGSSLFLARLLNPADFGLFSFVMVVIGAFALLQDAGVPAAIVYGRRPNDSVGGTALIINVAVSSALFVLAILLAPLLAQQFGDDAIRPIVIVLTGGFLITSLSSAQSAFLVKELKFRIKFIAELGSAVVSAATSIVLALAGFGVWSLVYGYLARTVASTLCLWGLSSVRPSFSFNWSVARELLRYGRHISFASVISFVLTNLDYFIVGQRLGKHDLGVYTMAFLIAGIPYIVHEAVAAVAFPASAQIRDDRESLVRMTLDTFKIALLLSVPAAIVLVICAPSFALLALGDNWNGIVLPLQILSIYTIPRCLAMNFGPPLKALGRPDIIWKLAVLKLVIFAPLLLFGVGYGIAAVAVVQVVASLIFVPPLAVWLMRLMDIPAGLVWQVVRAPLVGTALVGGVLIVVAALPVGATLAAAPLGSLVLAGLALVVYLGTLVSLDGRFVALGRQSLGALWARSSPVAS